MKHIYMIDNYDSFTYNLVQYFQELDCEVTVGRNDQVSVEDIEQSGAAYLVISPGPCTPNEAGISLQAIKHFAGKLPILGVCLGHQAIGQVYGAKVVPSKRIMHGKLSAVTHDGKGVFKDLPSPYQATRYHSLSITDLPDCLECSALTDEGTEIMGVRHKTLPIEGVQHHPESILSEHGHQLLNNFLSFKV